MGKDLNTVPSAPQDLHWFDILAEIIAEVPRPSYRIAAAFDQLDTGA